MRRTEPKRPSKKVLDLLQSMEDKKGMFAVIEPDTGDFFLGRTLTEALKAAMRKYPDKVFYSIRIGQKAIMHI